MRARGLSALALLAIALAPVASAYEVRPLVHRIESNGRLTSSLVVVTNHSDRALPVEFGAFHMELDGESVRRGESADDDLLVFPPGALVPPGGVQAARIQWLGEPALDAARSYIVAVEQLPSPGLADEADSDASGVQLLLTFNVFVHVSPPGAEPELAVRERRLETAAGRSTAHLRIGNSGDGHAFGSLVAFELSAGTRRARLLPGEGGDPAADLFFPPGAEREVELRLPGEAWPSTTAIDIAYEE